MTFIEDNLISDEEIIYQSNVSWFVYLNALAWFAAAIIIFTGGVFGFGLNQMLVLVFSGVFVLVGLMRFSNAFTHQAFTEIGITNKRLIAKFGFIARETLEIPLNRIESVVIDQSVMERITNCGTVGVHGTGQTLAPVKFIDSPLKFRSELNEAISQYKSRYPGQY